jgi:hypothetical protein
MTEDAAAQVLLLKPSDDAILRLNTGTNSILAWY